MATIKLIDGRPLNFKRWIDKDAKNPINSQCLLSCVASLTIAPLVTQTNCALKSIVGGWSKPQIGDAPGVHLILSSPSSSSPKSSRKNASTSYEPPRPFFQQRKISAPWWPLSVFASFLAGPRQLFCCLKLSEFWVEPCGLFAFFAFVQKAWMPWIVLGG